MRRRSFNRNKLLVLVGLLGAGLLAFAVGKPHLTREMSTEIEIEASPERVWEELLSFESYEEWNPYILEVQGQADVGEELEVRMQAPNSEARTFHPEVLVVNPGRELRWSGSLPVPGSFNGEHYFLIEPSGGDRVRFVQGEKFSGLLVPLLWGGLDTNTRLGFEKMNRAFKEQVENNELNRKED